MARITIEDCLTQVSNRFDLILMAAKRARQLSDLAAESAAGGSLGGDAVGGSLGSAASGGFLGSSASGNFLGGGPVGGSLGSSASGNFLGGSAAAGSLGGGAAGSLEGGAAIGSLGGRRAVASLGGRGATTDKPTVTALREIARGEVTEKILDEEETGEALLLRKRQESLRANDVGLVGDGEEEGGFLSVRGRGMGRLSDSPHRYESRAGDKDRFGG